MILFIGLALGFMAGVLATGAIACLLFGLLHEEAVKAVEGYSGLRLLINVERPEPTRFRASLP
jgi:hypothetical protein